MSKVRRAEIIITDSIKVGGWELDGSYYMSGTDATKVLEKDESSIRSWMGSKASEALPSKDLNPVKITNFEGRGSSITLYTTTCVLAYWGHWAQNGNSKAFGLILALAGTDLERLYDVAFRGQQKSERAYINHRVELMKRLIRSREITKAYHGGFVLKCKELGWNGAQIHDAMTMKICGMNAAMARQLKQLLGGDGSVGLDHYQPKHELALRQLAVAKRVFTHMKKHADNWEERLRVAVAKAKKEERV